MIKPSLRMIHIRLTEDLHKRVRIRVAEKDTDIQHWVITLIEKALEKEEFNGRKR